MLCQAAGASLIPASSSEKGRATEPPISTIERCRSSRARQGGSLRGPSWIAPLALKRSREPQPLFSAWTHPDTLLGVRSWFVHSLDDPPETRKAPCCLTGYPEPVTGEVRRPS